MYLYQINDGHNILTFKILGRNYVLQSCIRDTRPYIKHIEVISEIAEVTTKSHFIELSEIISSWVYIMISGNSFIAKTV